MAAGLHDAARAVPRAEQAAARADLLGDGAIGHRRILEEYSPYLLDQMIAVVTASTLIAYTVLRHEPETAAAPGHDPAGSDHPVCALRHLPLSLSGASETRGGSPADMLLTDRPLLVCVALWALIVVLLLYSPLGTVNATRHRRSRTPARQSRPRPPRRGGANPPETVIDDYGRVMDLAGYRDMLSRERDTLLKLNLSWSKYFPSCSSQPWQVDGVVTTCCVTGSTGAGSFRSKTKPW